ncbi:MAG: gamma-glutamylcyclotransferase [Paracoccaceae bacterium]|nr:gamma-glutamylcyclotransferase [Paracoccaceae bacterium]
MPPPRQMRLTPELVARVPPFSGETGRLAGRSDLHSDEDIEAIRHTLMADAPASGDVWIFAYGSLIWNPEFDHVEERLATVSGWHRSFCLGWVRLYRGTPERPGIMLAMDRGGSCRGVVLRLPPKTARENLTKLLRRELPIKRPGRPPVRWVTARTGQGPVRAIAFPISRKSEAYLPGLTTETVVEALATAAGERGSMAEYLHNTVCQLEMRGIHDRYLWRLQELVADRISQQCL